MDVEICRIVEKPKRQIQGEIDMKTKNRRSFDLRLGVALLFGAGALALTAPAAQAAPPCPKDNCNDSDSCANVRRMWSACTITLSTKSDGYTDHCRDCDGNCEKHIVRVREVEKIVKRSSCSDPNDNGSSSCFIKQFFPTTERCGPISV